MRPLAEKVIGKVGVDIADDVEQAADALLSMLRPGDAVLVKASNSVGLAKLVERVSGELQETCST
jgi:UDP-N-acetylmuramoyl-tripeptide--D-alanyl-D-alanine ligase